MLEEPTPGGKAVTASTDDVTLGRAKTGRPHTQALRSCIIAAVMDGASYRQAAARFRHTGSIAAKPMGGNRRSRLKDVRESLLRRVAATPDLTLDQLQEELRVRGIRVGRTALRRFIKKSIIETGNERGVRRGGIPCKGSAPLWQ